jgi:hypothetical protein
VSPALSTVDSIIARFCASEVELTNPNIFDGATQDQSIWLSHSQMEVPACEDVIHNSPTTDLTGCDFGLGRCFDLDTGMLNGSSLPIWPLCNDVSSYCNAIDEPYVLGIPQHLAYFLYVLNRLLSSD